MLRPLLGPALRLSAFHRTGRCISGAAVGAEASALGVRRDPRFAELREGDLVEFRRVLGAANVLTEADDLAAYNRDWMGRFVGASRVVLRPESTEQVAAVLRHCAGRGLAVAVQGGNTGLVGGSVAVFDEVLLSMGLMDRVLDFQEESGVVVCEAGVVLGRLEQYLLERGHGLPLDLGAKGSCMIGGNVATNAGGSRFIRYGGLRGSVVGLEAVLPSGKVLEMGPLVRKDNTGYDLKQLMIGSEGTLGVITKVAVACPIKSSSVQVSVLKVESFASVRKLLRRAKQQLGEILSAYEFMDAEAVNLALKHLSHLKNPLSEPPEPSSFLVLIESAGSNPVHDREKLDKFLESSMEAEIVTDGVIAESESQAQALWELRESLPEAVLKAGVKGSRKYDVSLPMDVFYQLVEETRRKTSAFKGVEVVGWGHVGDGNLHLNIACGGDNIERVKSAAEPWVYEWVGKNGGSISAEHGLGLTKADKIGFSKSEASVELMQKIKDLIDPKGICSPYKVLPQRKLSGSIASEQQQVGPR